MIYNNLNTNLDETNIKNNFEGNLANNENDFAVSESYLEEWKHIPEVNLELPHNDNDNNAFTQKINIEHLIRPTYEYLDKIFLQYTEIKEEMLVDDVSCECFSFSSKSRGHLRIKNQLIKLDYLAYLSYDDVMINYMTIIKDIYCSLTNSKFPCPDNGSHWEDIGFQGNHPSSDLRSFALLSLLSIHQFTTQPITRNLSHKIFALSHHEVQNFPFCILCMNIIKFLYLEIKSMKLNDYLLENNINDIIWEFFRLFNAILFKFYTIWRNEGKTIVDSQPVFDTLLKLLKNDPNKLVAFYQRSVQTDIVKESGDAPVICDNYN